MLRYSWSHLLEVFEVMRMGVGNQTRQAKGASENPDKEQ